MKRSFNFVASLLLLVFLPAPKLMAQGNTAGLEDASIGFKSYMNSGYILRSNGRHYDAAKYFFQAALRNVKSSSQALAYAEVANSLTEKGFYQSASYFYLKAIGSRHNTAVKKALQSTSQLIQNLGGGVFKKYLLTHTKLSQFPEDQREFYLYFQGLNYLLEKKTRLALWSFSSISSEFKSYPQVLFLKGTANLFLGKINEGKKDFIRCSEIARDEQYRSAGNSGKTEQEALYYRCIAGVARALYQNKQYKTAELWYSKIDIKSIVWPQILYEWAWTYVAQGKYNHALGKLVTYKAPILDWFLNPEVSVLRALSYLQLCLYEDVNEESKYFVKRYGKAGLRIKNLLNSTANGRRRDFERLFDLGVSSFRSGMFKTRDPLLRMMNKFVQSPYFIRIAQTDSNTSRELEWIRRRDPGRDRGLSGFLASVLSWRKEIARRLGGLYVRDRLDTEYKSILKSVKTMDILKLQMIQSVKKRLQDEKINYGTDEFGNKVRGSLSRPGIFSNQYFWNFNGEFWIDELGGYIFALRSECI